MIPDNDYSFKPFSDYYFLNIIIPE